MLHASSPENVLYHFLHALNIQVPKRYINKQIRSHEEPTSMLCITDFLNGLYIENAAIEITADQLPQLPCPFLAYCEKEEGAFVLIQDLSKIDNSFYDTWTGLVIVTEPNPTPRPDIFASYTKDAKTDRIMAVICAIAILAIILRLFTQHINLTISALYITAIAGLITGLLISMKKLGIASPIADKLCSALGSDHCEKVIQSENSWLDLSAIVPIYFSTQLIAMAMFSITNTEMLLLTTIAAGMASLVTIYSIYYQFSHQQWCTLCMITNAILWSQCILLFSLHAHSTISFAPLFNSAFAYLFGAAVSLTLYLLAQKYLSTSSRYDELSIHHTAFKRNNNLLTALLSLHAPKEPPTVLQLGKPEAPIQLTMVCAPYCVPCARAHQQLEKIPDIGLSILFNYNNSEKTKSAILLLLTAIDEYTSHLNDVARIEKTAHILHHWYSTMNVDAFTEQYPVKGPATAAIITQAQQQGDWVKHHNIKFTPTVFVNGHQLAAPYTVFDLPDILPSMKDLLRQEVSLIA